jgi:DNA-binding response OmpR family regulator
MILLVEDDARVAGLIQEVLGLEGYAVELVRDGAVALDRVLTNDYEAILCDVSLPGLDGATIYRKLAQFRPDVLPRVAFITGHDTAKVTQLLETAPPPRTLRKPFGIDELRRFVRDVLNAA